MTEEQLKVLRRIIERSLNNTQLLILKELVNNAHYTNVTDFIENLSEKYNIPESTIRWNVGILRDIGFIRCGNLRERGIPVRIEESGKIILDVLSSDFIFDEKKEEVI
ncbi:MAG: hypothetical protein QXY45_04660 [Candidatus Aenigmatarchaeota archaeon]